MNNDFLKQLVDDGMVSSVILPSKMNKRTNWKNIIICISVIMVIVAIGIYIFY